MRLVSDILSDTWDKLLRLMIIMESNKQVIWMYSTLNRVLRKVWASLIAQGLKKKKKKVHLPMLWVRLGRSLEEEIGNGNLLQYSCLENPMHRGAWWVTIHGITKSQT